MRRFAPFLLIAAYVWLGFVPPEGVEAHFWSRTGEELMSRATTLVTEHLTPSAKALLARLGNNSKHLVSTLDQAIQKKDVKLCGSLESDPTDATAPSTGDWIAYCLARVLNAPERCNQITGTLGEPLKKLCNDYFASRN